MNQTPFYGESGGQVGDTGEMRREGVRLSVSDTQKKAGDVFAHVKMTSYILEAEAITGPWRMVSYMKDFGEQGYFLSFPSKFISPDGRTLWLCYSANFSPGANGVELGVNPPGGRYGLCLHEVTLLTPEEKGPSPRANTSATGHN